MPDYPFHYDPPKLRISDSEIAIQKVMLQSIAVVFRQTDAFAVPNAAKRTRWAAQRAKAEGMKKGAADLVVYGAGSLALGLPPLVAFIEVKAVTQLTPEQLKFLTDAHEMGHYCGVFRSDQTLVDKLREWGFR